MALTVRPIRFVAGEPPELHWHGGDPVASAFFTVLSLAFPPGERFFIETLSGVADRLPPQLAEEVGGFVRQEANHARQHIAFNRHLTAGGYATAELEAVIAARIDIARALPPLLRVAFTAALEHVTSIIARNLLRDPRLLAGMAPEVASFWRWHAIEEVEHKAVAFDVYMVLAKSMRPFRRWQMRLRAIRAATRVIVSYAIMAADLLVETGHDPRRTKARMLRFLLVSPGLYRQCVPDLLAFLLPGYHPRWVDDTRLLAEAEHAGLHPVRQPAPHPVEPMAAMSGL